MSIIDSITRRIEDVRNGIVDIQNAVNSVDGRSGDYSRKRIQAVDPTDIIDAPSGTDIINFPHDRPRYFISFAFEEYRRPTQFEGLSSAGLTDYIALPLPNNMKDNNDLEYAEEAGSLLIDGITRSWQQGADSARTGGVDAIMANIGTTAAQSADVLQGFGIQKALRIARSVPFVGDAVDPSLQLAGLADNPFMTVKFKGPKFKLHNFTWRLSPKSAEESNTIKRITDTLKKVAYPELLTAGAGGFYKYPHICWPKFNPDSLRNYLYNFKPCVITNVNIDYTPNDRPGVYEGTNAPVEVVLSISLQEIELWRNGGGTQTDLTTGTLPTVGTGDFNNVTSPPVRSLGTV